MREKKKRWSKIGVSSKQKIPVRDKCYFSTRNIESLLLCLREELTFINGKFGIVNEGIRCIVVFWNNIFLLFLAWVFICQKQKITNLILLRFGLVILIFFSGVTGVCNLFHRCRWCRCTLTSIFCQTTNIYFIIWRTTKSNLWTNSLKWDNGRRRGGGDGDGVRPVFSRTRLN